HLGWIGLSAGPRPESGGISPAQLRSPILDAGHTSLIARCRFFCFEPGRCLWLSTRPLAVAQGDSGACVGLPIAMCSSALNCPLLCHDRARPSDDADKRRKELPNHLVGAEK